MINFFLLLLCPCLLFANSEIVVKLETAGQLIPISISPIKQDNSSFEESYIEQLEEVLHFDFSNNGMTTLVEQGALYTITLEIEEHKLSARVLEKEVKDLLLSGYLDQDRKTLHRLSDTIYKELFGVEGIAASRFLYTLKNGEQSEVWEADYDGHNQNQLTHGSGYSVTPAYIPPLPGKTPSNFFYVSYKTGQPKIYIGPNVQRFSYLPGNQLMPTMSRQRDQVAFISDAAGNPDLFLQSFDSEKGPQGKPRQLYTTKVSTQGTPTFSPDGTRLAFVSNKDGTPRIYILTIPPPGTPLKEINPTLISKINRGNTAPAWSPDGIKIAYCAKTKGVRQIWIYDLLKKKERQLTQGPINKENPTWAPPTASTSSTTPPAPNPASSSSSTSANPKRSRSPPAQGVSGFLILASKDEDRARAHQ